LGKVREQEQKQKERGEKPKIKGDADRTKDCCGKAEEVKGD
jgi:hypothetical protein